MPDGTPVKGTRRSTRRGFEDVAVGTPGKSPVAKRSSGEDRDQPRDITRAQRTAKAMEGARKYLAGDFGTPPGAPHTLTRAAEWVRAELGDPQLWHPTRLDYYVNKVKAESPPVDARPPPAGAAAAGAVAAGHGGICRILKTHVLLLVVTFGACGGVLCSFRSWMTAQRVPGAL